MKNDGLLRRNWLKGAQSDAMHAVLCGAGHNLRVILLKLRLLFAWILTLLSNATDPHKTTRFTTCPPLASATPQNNELFKADYLRIDSKPDNFVKFDKLG
jgi:hypothetical protein